MNQPLLPGYKNSKTNPVIESYKEDISNFVKNNNYSINDSKMQQAKNSQQQATSIDMHESQRNLQKQQLMEEYKRELEKQITTKQANIKDRNTPLVQNNSATSVTMLRENLLKEKEKNSTSITLSDDANKEELLKWVQSNINDPNLNITKSDLENYNKENLLNDNFSRKSLISNQHQTDEKELIRKKLYADELKNQMEATKRKKEEEKKQLKDRDEEIERKFQIQLEREKQEAGEKAETKNRVSVHKIKDLYGVDVIDDHVMNVNVQNNYSVHNTTDQNKESLIDRKSFANQQDRNEILEVNYYQNQQDGQQTIENTIYNARPQSSQSFNYNQSRPMTSSNPNYNNQQSTDYNYNNSRPNTSKTDSNNSQSQYKQSQSFYNSYNNQQQTPLVNLMQSNNDMGFINDMNESDQVTYISKMFSTLKDKLHSLNTNDPDLPNYVSFIASQLEGLTEQSIRLSIKAKDEKLHLKEELLSLKEHAVSTRQENNELRNEIKDLSSKYTSLLESFSRESQGSRGSNAHYHQIEEEDLEESLNSDTKFINFNNNLANTRPKSAVPNYIPHNHLLESNYSNPSAYGSNYVIQSGNPSFHMGDSQSTNNANKHYDYSKITLDRPQTSLSKLNYNEYEEVLKLEQSQQSLIHANTEHEEETSLDASNFLIKKDYVPVKKTDKMKPDLRDQLSAHKISIGEDSSMFIAQNLAKNQEPISNTKSNLQQANEWDEIYSDSDIEKYNEYNQPESDFRYEDEQEMNNSIMRDDHDQSYQKSEKSITQDEVDRINQNAKKLLEQKRKGSKSSITRMNDTIKLNDKSSGEGWVASQEQNRINFDSNTEERDGKLIEGGANFLLSQNDQSQGGFYSSQRVSQNLLNNSQSYMNSNGKGFNYEITSSSNHKINTQTSNYLSNMNNTFKIEFEYYKEFKRTYKKEVKSNASSPQKNLKKRSSKASFEYNDNKNQRHEDINFKPVENERVFQNENFQTFKSSTSQPLLKTESPNKVYGSANSQNDKKLGYSFKQEKESSIHKITNDFNKYEIENSNDIEQKELRSEKFNSNYNLTADPEDEIDEIINEEDKSEPNSELRARNLVASMERTAENKASSDKKKTSSVKTKKIDNLNFPPSTYNRQLNYEAGDSMQRSTDRSASGSKDAILRNIADIANLGDNADVSDLNFRIFNDSQSHFNSLVFNPEESNYDHEDHLHLTSLRDQCQDEVRSIDIRQNTANPFSPTNLLKSKLEDSQFRSNNSAIQSPSITHARLEDKFNLEKKKEYKVYKSNDSVQRSDNLTFNQEQRIYSHTNYEKSSSQPFTNSVQNSKLSVNPEESYGGSVTLEQVRHEKKKQKILDKQKNKIVQGDFENSMMRLQNKIDNLQSHKRQIDEEEEEIEARINRLPNNPQKSLGSGEKRSSSIPLLSQKQNSNSYSKLTDSFDEYALQHKNKKKILYKNEEPITSPDLETSIERIINFDNKEISDVRLVEDLSVEREMSSLHEDKHSQMTSAVDPRLVRFEYNIIQNQAYVNPMGSHMSEYSVLNELSKIIFDPYYKGERKELKVGELVPNSVIDKQLYHELAEYYKSLHNAEDSMDYRYTSNIIKTIPSLKTFELISLLNKNSQNYLGRDFDVEKVYLEFKKNAKKIKNFEYWSSESNKDLRQFYREACVPQYLLMLVFNLMMRAVILTYFENEYDSVHDYVIELEQKYIESIEDYCYTSEINSVLKKLNSEYQARTQTPDLASFYKDGSMKSTVHLVLNPDEKQSLALNETLTRHSKAGKLKYIYEHAQNLRFFLVSHPLAQAANYSFIRDNIYFVHFQYESTLLTILIIYYSQEHMDNLSLTAIKEVQQVLNTSSCTMLFVQWDEAEDLKSVNDYLKLLKFENVVSRNLARESDEASYLSADISSWQRRKYRYNYFALDWHSTNTCSGTSEGRRYCEFITAPETRDSKDSQSTDNHFKLRVESMENTREGFNVQISKDKPKPLGPKSRMDRFDSERYIEHSLQVTNSQQQSHDSLLPKKYPKSSKTAQINQYLEQEYQRDGPNNQSQMSNYTECSDRPNKIKISKSKVKEIRLKEGRQVNMNDNFENSKMEESTGSLYSNKRYK